MFGEPDRDREIGHDAIRIALAAVAIETGRQIERENKRVFFASKPIDLLGRCPHRFPQKVFRAEAKETIENDQRGGTCFCTSMDERKLVPPEACDFLARKLCAILLGESQAKVYLPAGLFQASGGDESVTAIMAFSGENNRLSGAGEKSLDRARYARTRSVHERFNFHTVGEGSLFRRPHRRGTYER
jgi:hypothetical protein